MTSTETTTTAARRAALLPVVATGVLGVVLAVAAAAVTGSDGLWGVVVGIALTMLSLGLGSIVLAWVTDVSPVMSLVVALMTYTLQVVLLLAAYVVLQGNAAARDAVSGQWLGATVIATTVIWLALQVRALKRSRQPYFDETAETASSVTSETSSGTTSGRPEAGTT